MPKIFATSFLESDHADLVIYQRENRDDYCIPGHCCYIFLGLRVLFALYANDAKNPGREKISMQRTSPSSSSCTPDRKSAEGCVYIHIYGPRIGREKMPLINSTDARMDKYVTGGITVALIN